MNLKSTLALILLASCGLGAWVASGTFTDPWGVIPPVKKPDDPVEKKLRLPATGDLRAITIERGGEKAQFTRVPDGSWRMAGNWHTRPAEMERVVEALGNLGSRFAPETPSEWAKYGLDKPAVKVTLTSDDKKEVTLSLGEPKQGGTKFDRPTYLRVGDSPEAWQVAPGLVALLDRPADHYLLRRVFPSKRESKDKEGGGTARIARLDGKSLTVEEKGEKRFTITRGKDGWELSYPLRDALDPASSGRLLEAAADLWAAKFVDAPKEFKPEKTLSVVGNDGTTLTLDVGPETKPEGPGKPKAVARLRGFDRFFEIESGKLTDLTPNAESLRDGQLARFKTEDAREVTITTPRGTVVMRHDPRPKKDGDPMPPPPEWRITSPITAQADSSGVERLLSTLSGLSARDRDAGKKVELGTALAALGVGPLAMPPLGFIDIVGTAKPTATVTVKVGEDPEKTFTVRLGHHDKDAKKLFATSGDWPRINSVDDELATLVLNKGVLDFRGKKLLDLKGEDVKSMSVSRIDLSFLAAIGADPIIAAGILGANATGSLALDRGTEGWSLSAPVKARADAGRADELAGKLAGLEVLTFVSDKAEPGAYGLGLPTLKAAFTLKDGRKVLLVGGERPEGGHYARLEDTPEVFAVSRELYDALARDSLSYRPPQLWTLAPGDDPVEFTIRRAGAPEYKITNKGAGWEVTGPFTVSAPLTVVERLVAALRTPRAEAYLAHDAPTGYGLDSPRVVITLKTKSGKEQTLSLGAGRAARSGKEPAVIALPQEVAEVIDQSPLDFLDRNLFTFDPLAVTAFSRTMGTETFEAAKKDDDWKIIRPSEQPGDDKRIPDLFRVMAGLQADKFVAYAPRDLKPFGLDSPAATLTIKTPTEATLLIGSVLPDGSRHAQVKDSPAVGIIAADDAKRLMAAALTFRDHLLARLPDAEEARLTMGERKAVFAKPEGTWKLAQPAMADADHDAMEAFMNSLARLRADEFISEKPALADLKKYGLDKPEASWAFSTGGKEALGLKVGALAPGSKRRYAQLAGKDLVFLLEPGLSARAVAEYRPRGVFKAEIDPASVEAVRFGHAKEPFELRKMDGEWRFVGKPDERVNKAALNDALSALRGLRLERYVVDGGADLKLYGLDPVGLALEITTPSGKHFLLIGGIQDGSKRRYAKHPGGDKAVFVLDEAASVKLWRTMVDLTAK